MVLTDLNAQGGATAVAKCAAAGGRAMFQRTDIEAGWISGAAMVVDGGINTGNARFRLAGLPDSGFSGRSFEM